MLNGLNRERAGYALQAIPANTPRDQWVKTGMAFHAAGGDFETFDRWSAQADSYNAQACRATFHSFKATTGGVSAGALFGMARDYGWQEGAASSRPTPDRTTKSALPLLKPAPDTGAGAVYKRCEAATSGHPYIAEKRAAGVPLEGLRVVPIGDPLRILNESMAGALVVPCMDSDGALSTLQLIPLPQVAARLKAAGKASKVNLPGSKVDGWFTVGNLTTGGTAYVCEGIGQAWACWQATGAAAVVAFGAGNIGKVAKALRLRDDTARLVLVPDVGKELEALKIAAEVRAAVAVMPVGELSNFDANDLAQRDGCDVLAQLLEAATEPPKPEPLLKPVSVFDVLSRPSLPPAFVWDGYLPKGNVALFGAHGGTGKSTIALMLAVCVASGRALFGVDTVQCPVLFVSLEDGINVVRHRLANICRILKIDPEQLRSRLHIVDGTEHPELFVAEARGGGETTSTYRELRRLVQSEDIGLVVVDNASDAFGGDEIQRRQVRAFMRALAELARLTNCAVMLLAHVDKATSRSRKAEGGEGYSGSTAWHNSARSRLFLTRAESGVLTIEHQKSNLGRLRDPIGLEWLDGGLPQLLTDDPINDLNETVKRRAEDDRAAALLRLIAEFESRHQYCSPATTSRNHVFALLQAEPAFKRLKLNADGTKRIVTQCQRAKWIDILDYRDQNRKPHQRWTVTNAGKLFAGLLAPTAPTAPTTDVGTDGADGAKAGAPTAPTALGGYRGIERAQKDGAELKNMD